MRTLGTRWGKESELHHEAEHVHEDAGVFDAAVFQAVDDHAPDFYRAAGWGYADERALVGAGPLEAGEDFVALGDLLFDGKVQVREGGAHAAENVVQAFEAWTLAGEWNLLDDVFPDELRGGVESALVDDFFDEVADDGGVVLRHCAVIP